MQLINHRLRDLTTALVDECQTSADLQRRLQSEAYKTKEFTQFLWCLRLVLTTLQKTSNPEPVFEKLSGDKNFVSLFGKNTTTWKDNIQSFLNRLDNQLSVSAESWQLCFEHLRRMPEFTDNINYLAQQKRLLEDAKLAALRRRKLITELQDNLATDILNANQNVAINLTAPECTVRQLVWGSVCADRLAWIFNDEYKTASEIRDQLMVDGYNYVDQKLISPLFKWSGVDASMTLGERGWFIGQQILQAVDYLDTTIGYINQALTNLSEENVSKEYPRHKAMRHIIDSLVNDVVTTADQVSLGLVAACQAIFPTEYTVANFLDCDEVTPSSPEEDVPVAEQIEQAAEEAEELAEKAKEIAENVRQLTKNKPEVDNDNTEDPDIFDVPKNTVENYQRPDDSIEHYPLEEVQAEADEQAEQFANLLARHLQLAQVCVDSLSEPSSLIPILSELPFVNQLPTVSTEGMDKAAFLSKLSDLEEMLLNTSYINGMSTSEISLEKAAVVKGAGATIAKGIGGFLKSTKRMIYVILIGTFLALIIPHVTIFAVALYMTSKANKKDLEQANYNMEAAKDLHGVVVKKLPDRETFQKQLLMCKKIREVIQMGVFEKQEYNLDKLLKQLAAAGVPVQDGAVVVPELPSYDEPIGTRGWTMIELKRLAKDVYAEANQAEQSSERIKAQLRAARNKKRPDLSKEEVKRIGVVLKQSAKVYKEVCRNLGQSISVALKRSR